MAMDATRSRDSAELRRRIDGHLRELTRFPDRHVGGPGNQAATEMVANVMASLGWSVRRVEFDCVDWEPGGAAVEAGPARFDLHVGPYSLPVDVVATLVAADQPEKLETELVRGCVVLAHGELAGGQVMPKNFAFYNPEDHRRIVRALEVHHPAAIVAATGRDAEMVGSQYPFPMFEDGDLDIPNAYMTDTDGERLLAHVGSQVHLTIDSRRIPAAAEQVVATRRGHGPGRIVVSAHIDSRMGSPGALDNASGVAVLLALGELLADYGGDPAVEIVPYNGEDHYASPGEMIWLAENEGRLDEILVGINVDDLGLRGSINHVSFYECPDAIASTAMSVAARHPLVAEGPRWYQGDHAMLVQQGRPAIALASSEMGRFMAEFAHTERDAIGLADPGLIAAAALYVADLVTELARIQG
jgi:aminopeptidase YwaD